MTNWESWTLINDNSTIENMCSDMAASFEAAVERPKVEILAYQVVILATSHAMLLLYFRF